MHISVSQFLALSGASLVISWLVHWVYKWMNPSCNSPGSMGYPIVGETLEFLKGSPSLDIPDYFNQRMKRYGPVFKTSVLGQPAVVSTDAAVNRYILQQEGGLFRVGYPAALNKIFGEKSIQAFEGATHKFIRRAAFSMFGLENLKESLLPEMESAVRERLAYWATKPSVDVRHGAPDILFDLVCNKCFGFNSTKSRQLRKSFDTLFNGLLSFPTYLPGTAFYRSMQARKDVDKMMRDAFAERLRTPGKKHGDLLDQIVEQLQGEEPLITESFAVDMASTLLFASVFTLSGTTAMAFKSLHDNPQVVHALQIPILTQALNQTYIYTVLEYLLIKP